MIGGIVGIHHDTPMYTKLLEVALDADHDVGRLLYDAL